MTTTTEAPAAPCVRRPTSIATSCTCPSCRIRQRRVEKARRFGLLVRPASEPAWERFTDALDAGWTTRAVASAAGVNHETLQGALLVYRTTGRRRDFGYTTTAALTGPWGRPTAGRVPTLGATRRLRALAAIGWSLLDLHTADPRLPMMTLSDVRKGKNPTMSAAAAALVEDLYDRLSGTPGSAPDAARRARAARWAAPAAWDGSLDDPDVLPYGATPAPVLAPADLDDDEAPQVDVEPDVDLTAVERVLAGEDRQHRTAHALTRDERVAVVRLGTERGLSSNALSTLLDCAERSVTRIRTRHGFHAPRAQHDTWDAQLAS